MYATVVNRYFALIPIGKLPTGSYAVDVVQTTERAYTMPGFQEASKEVGEKRICKSFAFTIVQGKKEAANNE